ncbi:DUF3073 domain-containing protein [Nocardioides sp.]|jgi:hypothetical protein|uniref:DUF3073 domain-containing protein n=1 Tax=Nocardioides sp. TaxID=35761 RepID=UPI0026239AA2|nr:DUF3073 domain-containing protein [Nocardioides sp.]MCW2735639.1 hypothetical protein [Nocardioides sp.]
MGRGRAKAKQTKVARELKYNSGGTDLERLKAELTGGSPAAPATAPVDDDEFDDPYASDDDDEDEDDLAAK